MRNSRLISGLVSGLISRRQQVSQRKRAKFSMPHAEPLEDRTLFNASTPRFPSALCKAGNNQSGNLSAGGVATYSLNTVAPARLYFRVRAYDANATVEL